MATVRQNSKFEIRNSKFLICLVVVAVALMIGCRTTVTPTEGRTIGIPGEPHNYSAIVSRTVDDGARKQVTVTRFARRGEMLREQWSQDGETLVCIWRPDLGKVFLLSLERRVYVESDLNGDRKPEAPNGSQEMSPKLDPVDVDRAFEYESAPERVETEELPEEVIDGRSCRVFRQRAVFANGLIEMTTTWLSPDLEGLAIRVESETEGGANAIKISTERRDISTDVTPDQFEIPSGFKRVSSLSAPSGRP